MADKIKFPSSVDLHKFLVVTVKVDNPWYYEVSKCAPQEALRNLASAFKRMHKVKGSGFPRFKKKNVADSFYLSGCIHIVGNKIKLPIIGWVKCHEVVPVVNPKNVTISKRAGRWFIAFKLETAPNPNQLLDEPVGVDLGVSTLATCSNGFIAENPKAYRKATAKLAKLQKELCRRTKGGKNREKTKLKLAKCHYKVSSIRSDTIHKLTTHLAQNHSEKWKRRFKCIRFTKKSQISSSY